MRQYIPLPLRCARCLRYGHTTKSCKNEKICADCTNIAHVIREDGETCENMRKCINCTENNFEAVDHSALNKKCPVFLREKEIQAIVTIEKTDRRTAVEKYKQRHANRSASYAAIATVSNINNDKKETIEISNTPQRREIITYDDITPEISKKINNVIIKEQNNKDYVQL